MLAAGAAAQSAQRVDLPHGTGHLEAAAEWTVLRAKELALAGRATDPQAELARAMLQGMVEELRRHDRTNENVVLHAAGPAGQLRLVNCYASAFATTGAELATEKAIAELRKTFESALAAGGAKVTFAGHVDPKLWAAGSVRLRFDLQQETARWQMDYHAVPAGDSLQFFEVAHFADDKGAEPAIDALLRTFDGAKDSERGSLMRSALLGGVCGAAGGVVVWLLRRGKKPAAAAAN